MPDRRRRTALHLPTPSGPVLLPRERQSSSTGPSGTSGSSDSPGAPDSPDSPGPSGSAGSAGSADDNPFAAPPEGRPDQPWQPRHPANGDSPDADSGSGSDTGSGRGGWGSQWSSRQPGRSSGGFGSRPGNQNGQNDPGSGKDGPEGGRGGLRWDPTDVSQRRARYALLAGMWALFFVLFDLPEIALLLGSLAVYWGASSLRNKSDKAPEEGEKAVTGGSSPAPVRMEKTPPAGARTDPWSGRDSADRETSPAATRPQTTAAVSGLVAAGIALVFVATTFTVQLVYRDYYSCVNDALTKTGQLSCNELLPHSLEPVFGVKE
ncbi:hypothetical protein [Streptomyces sp. NPDC088258]|uniref:hypothetical protein n=1 Tax=Streptomyces sp. NPDC088258 TaxID=3365849 RepID=UPI003824E230